LAGQSRYIKSLRIEEEYYNKTNNYGKYVYYMLIRLPKSSDENKIMEKTYGTAPIWRSVVIPGWGQIYKK